VDLRRVVGSELLSVLQGRDTTEEPFIVRVGDEQVLADADLRPVRYGDVGPEGRIVLVFAYRESLGCREDAQSVVAARRGDVDGFEVVDLGLGDGRLGTGFVGATGRRVGTSLLSTLLVAVELREVAQV